MRTFAEIVAQLNAGKCASIRNRECQNQREPYDYMCAGCRKEYDDYLYSRDVGRQELLSGEWQGRELEPSARYPQLRGDLYGAQGPDWLDESALEMLGEGE